MTKSIFSPEPLPIFWLGTELNQKVTERVGWKLDHEWFVPWGDMAAVAYWGLVSDLERLG